MPTLAIIWQGTLSASFDSLRNWNQSSNLVCLGEPLCEIPDFDMGEVYLSAFPSFFAAESDNLSKIVDPC